MWLKVFAVLTATVALIACTPGSNVQTINNQTALNPNSSSSKSTIVRDSYGIPHIYADTQFGLFYGYGYALGQDRLFQLEMAKRGAQGRAAEVLGVNYLEGDKRVRQGLDPAAVQRQIDALTADLREPFEAYAAGINAWIGVVGEHPQQLLPAEFTHFDFLPSTWTSYDVFMLFIGPVAQIFCDSNEELNNLAFLRQLIEQHGSAKGWSIFNATMPLYDLHSPVTVSTESATPVVTPKEAAIPRYLNRLADIPATPVRLAYSEEGQLMNIKDAAARASYLARNLSVSGPAGNAGFRTASNIWLSNGDKVDGAKAVLVSGPQMGWGAPSYIHAVGLHGAGFDVVGKGAFGFPFFITAYTEKFAWGTTYGASDQTDIFQLRLNPDDPTQYQYKGQYLKFEERTESIVVKNSAAVEYTSYRSVHGVVVAKDIANGIAYSKKRSWEGAEVMTAATWLGLPKAANFDSFRAQLEPMSTTVNFYFMDRAGNIGYKHSGKYPLRSPDHDNRLPAPGDGSMDWRGMLPFAKNPKAYNPEQGYISNWNNRPSRGWPASDSWAGNWAKTDRVSAINQRLDSSTAFTPQQLWDINAEVAHADLNVEYLLPLLKTSLESGFQSSETEKMLNALEDWDRRWIDQDNDGYYDSPGPAIMEAWLRQLLIRVLKDDIGEAFFYRFASPSYPTEQLRGSWNSGVGIKLIVRNLEALKNGERHYDFFNGESPAAAVIDAFQSAYEKLYDNHGNSFSNWKIEVPSLKFSPFNYNGVPQTFTDSSIGLSQMMNRGSESNFYVVTPEGISGRDAYTPGQSGFIAPDGTKDQHFSDQLELFEAFATKPLPLSRVTGGEVTELRY